MSANGCLPTTMAVTELLRFDCVAAEWRRLKAAGAGEREFVEAMCAAVPPAIAEVIREEFAVLPALTLQTLIDGWSLADAGGKQFEFVSVPPSEPIEYARRKRVRLTVDVEEDRVVVSLGHIATRHADWYAMRRWGSMAGALAAV